MNSAKDFLTILDAVSSSEKGCVKSNIKSIEVTQTTT